MNYKQIGRRIRDCRDRKNMTQTELAERTELSAAYIGFIENARKHPSLDSLIRIVNALDTTLDIILTGYQRHDTAQYNSDTAMLLEDCSTYEKRIIYTMLVAMKSALREGLLVPKADECR
jgi:transcriptional regulator with XRE-family HTH domain